VQKVESMSRILLLLLLCSVNVSSATANPEKVALVVGNSRYDSVSQLTNPRNDATDIAAALEAIDFDVTVEFDVAQVDMLGTLRRFSEKARLADIALIYYAGHGIEVGNQNYLIPIDARLSSDADVPFETVTLDQVILAAEGAKQLSLVILDACRNNPFIQKMDQTSSTRSIGRGLAEIEPNGNTMVAYAAKAGSVAWDGNGRNSPYAGALINALGEPKLEISFLFRRIRDQVLEFTQGEQEPYTYGSLSSEQLFLNEQIAAVEADVVYKPAQDLPSTDPIPNTLAADSFQLKQYEALWAAVKNTNDPEAIQFYVDTYPESPFVPLAEFMLGKMKASGSAPPNIDAVPTAISPNKKEEPTPSPQKEIPADSDKLAGVLPEPKSTLPKPEAPPLDSIEPPTQTSRATSTLEINPRPDQEIVIKPPTPLGRDEIRSVQLRLSILGYRPGIADGIPGPRTRNAIIAYEKANGLPPIGDANSEVLASLKETVSDQRVKSHLESIAKQAAIRREQQRAIKEQQRLKTDKAKPKTVIPEPKVAKKERPWWMPTPRSGRGDDRDDNDDNDRSSGGGRDDRDDSDDSCSGWDC